MEAVRAEVGEKRRVLGFLRADRVEGWDSFKRALDLELTFTSNAIEGNTLTAAETTLVVEKGLTIGGKPLRDHLEAIDHFEALGYVRRLARERRAVGELDVRNLHRLVLLRSAPEIAGRHADQGRYVLTAAGRQAFPSPAEVPALMGGFADWLAGAGDGPDAAFSAHLRLVQIYPFNDGNGRVARLLMNLLLLRGGYVPVVVRPRIGWGIWRGWRRWGRMMGRFGCCCGSGWRWDWGRLLGLSKRSSVGKADARCVEKERCCDASHQRSLSVSSLRTAVSPLAIAVSSKFYQYTLVRLLHRPVVDWICNHFKVLFF